MRRETAFDPIGRRVVRRDPECGWWRRRNAYALSLFGYGFAPSRDDIRRQDAERALSIFQDDGVQINQMMDALWDLVSRPRNAGPAKAVPY
jgi:hypothetical protein